MMMHGNLKNSIGKYNRCNEVGFDVDVDVSDTYNEFDENIMRIKSNELDGS